MIRNRSVSCFQSAHFWCPFIKVPSCRVGKINGSPSYNLSLFFFFFCYNEQLFQEHKSRRSKGEVPLVASWQISRKFYSFKPFFVFKSCFSSVFGSFWPIVELRPKVCFSISSHHTNTFRWKKKNYIQSLCCVFPHVDNCIIWLQ